MKLTTLFFTVIFIEGYVVLATELLAIRQLIPFVGSGTETIAIVIAAVLLPLAIGYFVGGRYKPRMVRGTQVTVREKLIRNLINASLILTFGLSYLILELFFSLLSGAGITHRVAQAAIYSLLFLVYPVFLLGQTVPLVSNYFSRHKLSEATGKMLFASTVGSFCGSIISTLILMTTIGVHNTVIVNIGFLVAVVFLLSKHIVGVNNILMLCVLGVAAVLNNGTSLSRTMHMIGDNNYNTIMVTEKDNARTLILNRSSSAKYTEKMEERHPHLQYIENNFIKPIAGASPPKSILVIGAGGFMLGLEDTTNDYTFVDIDKTLKAVAEDHFLKRKLGANKHFVPEPGEVFLLHNTRKYDLIFLDAYTNMHALPPQLITEEFFTHVKNALATDGIFLANVISSPNFSTRFSYKIDNTLESVFPHISRQIIPYEGSFNAWNNSSSAKNAVNLIYSYFHKKQTDGIYTIDKNNYFLDH